MSAATSDPARDPDLVGCVACRLAEAIAWDWAALPSDDWRSELLRDLVGLINSRAER